MKHLAQFLLCCCLVAVPLTARSGGGHGGGGFHGGGGGFHGAVGGFHGGGFSGGFHGGFGTVGSGYNGNRFYRRWNGFGLRYSPGYYGSGYGYPYSGFWGWGLGDWGYPYYDTGSYQPYDYGDQQPPVVIYQTAPTYAPPAPVHSEIHEYPETPPTATIRPAGEPPIYLIAIKGQDNILAGITYWVEGDTLQYINLQHVQKHVAIDSIDRALTTRLNHERNMDLRLPPA